MPLLLNDTTISPETRFRPLMELADEAFPQTPDQMLALEQLPSFEVLDRVAARAHAAAEAEELFDDIVAETLITHDEAEQAAA